MTYNDAIRPLLLYVADWHARCDERLFEGEAAPDVEAHQIAPPQRRDVSHVFDQRAMPVHAVLGHIGAHVAVDGNRPGGVVPGGRHVQQRTRLNECFVEVDTMT